MGSKVPAAAGSAGSPGMGCGIGIELVSGDGMGDVAATGPLGDAEKNSGTCACEGSEAVVATGAGVSAGGASEVGAGAGSVAGGATQLSTCPCPCPAGVACAGAAAGTAAASGIGSLGGSVAGAGTGMDETGG